VGINVLAFLTDPDTVFLATIYSFPAKKRKSSKLRRLAA
jgi:hypothetical protein